jgi:hypothetical protein
MTNLEYFKSTQKETEYTLMDKVNKFSYSPAYGVEISFAYNSQIITPIDDYLSDTREMKEINNDFSSQFIGELFNKGLFDFDVDIKLYESSYKNNYVIESKNQDFTIMFTFGFFEKKIVDANKIELY